MHAHLAIADYFIICSAQSERQAIAISEHVRDELAKNGIKPIGIEGVRYGRWIVMDYNDVVLHIFLEPIRRFYDLESLWSDTERAAVE
ncbi:MAG: ribosome silencing factor [Deltaproteobacteria bacterium]|nr:ribosome silencing factor [Deltaproteobacteria bacterium]MCL5791538.1 ribosome silencing factor [Deltaproteobacteria bacterium]